MGGGAINVTIKGKYTRTVLNLIRGARGWKDHAQTEIVMPNAKLL